MAESTEVRPWQAGLRVRDVMVPSPRVLPVTATAQAAGMLLSRPDVRAVLVVDGERLAGTLTRETLVAGVVAAGRDPKATAVGELLKVERLPVVEQGRLVGVLSRSVLQRRLVEDQPPASPPENEPLQ
jgi:CBS domain-containing protein